MGKQNKWKQGYISLFAGMVVLQSVILELELERTAQPLHADTLVSGKAFNHVVELAKAAAK